MYNNNVINIQMSTGYKAFGIDLGNYFQPFFSGSEVAQLEGIKINGVQAFARRDNDPNNAPTVFNTGYKYNGVDIAQFANKANASLTIQITGSKTYNGQGQQANIILISPTNSWITVQTSTVTDAGLYDSTYFSFTPPTGYNNLTVNPSTFSIIPSEINLIPNGGPTSFTWTGSPITFTSYSVSGVFSADTGWSVSDTVNTGVGSYYAYLSTSSQNYVVGTLQSINWTINPSSVPGPPIIGASTAGDKSFTANWSAPTVTGGEITGYKVSYSTNGGQTWSSEVTTTNLTYTWSGNGVIFNGNSYIARVRAYNSLGDGGYSGNPSGVIPTFAAPTIVSFNNTAGYPSTSAPNQRPFFINFTPTSCVNYSYTIIYIQASTFESFGGYYPYVNGSFTNLTTNTTGNQNTGNIFTVYAQNISMGGQFYSNGPSQPFYAYCITYNNDGYGVQSAVVGPFTTIAQQSYYVFNPASLTLSNAIQLYQTGTFNVTGNTFSQTSVTFITSDDWYVNKLNVSARTATLATSINITSSSRSFLVDYTFATTGTFSQVFNGQSSPFNNNNASTTRNVDVDIGDVNYGNNGDGRIRVRGAGSIGTFAAGQVINVVVTAFGQTRTLTFF